MAAATSGAEVKYRWPMAYKLDGIDFCVRSAVDTELANTRLRMLDDRNIELCTDGFGTTVSMNGLANRGIPTFSSLLAGGRVNAFQRIVRAGDIWVFQVFNDNAVDVVPELFFRLASPVELRGAA